MDRQTLYEKGFRPVAGEVRSTQLAQTRFVPRNIAQRRYAQNQLSGLHSESP